MQQFEINLRSFQQVQDFVSLALQQDFDISVGNEHQHINGKELLGMFSLDYSAPVQVSVNCDDDAFHTFRQAVLQLHTAVK